MNIISKVHEVTYKFYGSSISVGYWTIKGYTIIGAGNFGLYSSSHIY